MSENTRVSRGVVSESRHGELRGSADVVDALAGVERGVLSRALHAIATIAPKEQTPRDGRMVCGLTDRA